MLFALVLVAFIIGSSGQAFELITKKASDYSTRYSLERVANDASDALAKIVGKPYNWEDDIKTLETLGLAELDEFTGKALQNTLDVGKLSQLKILCRSSNWDPKISEVKAVMDFFGGTSNFELRVIDCTTENILWDIWPRWDTQASGAESSSEVVAIRRAVTVKYGDIKVDSGQLQRVPGQNKVYTIWFEIQPDELDVFDWYIIVKTSDTASKQIESAFIFVNQPSNGSFDYHFQKSNGIEQTFPKIHGGVEADQSVNENLHEGWNFLNVKVAAGASGAWAEVYVMAVPSCTPPNIIKLETGQRGLPAILELKLWR
jgi:hypothetical protein